MSNKLLCLGCLWVIFMSGVATHSYGGDIAKRQAYLKQLLSVLPPERPDKGRVTRLDATWQDWLERTGELPPDFDAMPSLPFLPDPFILDEGGKNIPITTMQQWKEKLGWIRKEIKHWITGTFPPPPNNLQAKIISEKKEGNVTLRWVELRFGPDHRAKMTVELMIPPGDRPLPVFMTQSNHRAWAMVAVRRGYIGCTYAGNDGNDDTEAYQEIWYPEYDFTRTMRRAWGSHRVVDYLYTLPIVDKACIGITGHSRNGKQALMAAAFDDRITAVVPSSGNTGESNPWRYTVDKYNVETIAQITTNFPHWMHPRLRFFIGREHKLPVDQNLMMALVAPRGLMLSSAITEGDDNPWGFEQAYRSAQGVYEFLGAENKLAINLRDGVHGTHARDIEVFCDFFDSVFGRGKIEPPGKLFYDYTFRKWLGLSGERINPLDYPVKSIDDLLTDTDGKKIKASADWEKKKAGVKERIKWSLGEEPGYVKNPGPTRFSVRGGGFGDYLGLVIGQPQATKNIGRTVINDRSGLRGFGDYLTGNLYYPTDDNGETISDNMPVIIYLHDYAYSCGFKLQGRRRTERQFINDCVKNGYAVFRFDQIGCGTRIEEGTHFYQRYPNWSKMGRMVADTKAAVDAMAKLEVIDKERIYVAGYSLGGTVGLYAAALDERIAGVLSVCGFTPMRLDTPAKGTEGIRAYSHLHGLLPRLGFFVGNESRIPYDFHEILACIAPRPLLVIAPTWDRDATCADAKLCVEEVRKLYEYYNAKNQLQFLSPNDYNRFSEDMQQAVLEWFQKR